MDDCIFCKIVKGSIPAEMEAQTSLVLAFKSIDPVAKEHILIIPKEHITTFLDLEDKHKEILIDMAKVAQELVEKKKIQNGYKLVFNGGKYQAIPHIHWHLLGGELYDKEDSANKT